MTPTQTGSSLDGLERRRCARHQVKSLAYLDIGADNGGIVLNISETGLAVHAVSVLPPDPTVDLRLQLHKSCKRLETRAKVAWISDTKKEAGVEFIDLPEEVRLEIKEWLALENLEPLYIAREKQRLQAQPAAPEPTSTRAKARSDKWTNLVSEWASIPAGIDRVGESPRAAGRPGTAMESMPAKEAIAPVDLAAILAGDEPATDLPAPDFGNTEALQTECKQPGLESRSIATRPIERPLFPNSPESGDLQYRRRDPEVGLPSDKLLSSMQRSDVVVPSDSKAENATESRNRLGPGSSTAHGEDFARKTRELFGPKSLPGAAPRPKDTVGSLLNSATTTAAWRAKENLNEHSLATVPMSGLVVASALPAETSLPNAARPGTSSRPLTARLEAPKDEPKASPSERSWNLRSFVGLLALCLLLSAGCLALGIVVGRSVAMHSPNDANSGNDAAAQAAPADQPVSNGAISPGQKQGKNRNQKLTYGHSSPLDVASHQKPAADRSRGENMDSSENGSDDPPDHAQAEGSTVQASSEATSPADTTSTNGASFTTPPAAPISATAPAIHATVIPNSNAAPRTPPPADRLVAAHLIYRVEPFYPKEALQQRVEGTVKIHATVGQDGRVKNLRVVSGPAALTSAALSAAQYWRYVPALRNGEPIETDEDISIEFHLLH
jgi:TonB family protein